MDIKVYKSNEAPSLDNMIFIVNDVIYSGNDQTKLQNVFYPVGVIMDKENVLVNGLHLIPLKKILNGYRRIYFEDLPETLQQFLINIGKEGEL